MNNIQNISNSNRARLPENPKVNNAGHPGHVISNSVNDDEDIQREIQNMFIRTSILIQHFSKCSLSVKTVLFKSYTVFVCMMLLCGNFSRKAQWTGFNPATTIQLLCKGLFWL